MNLKQLYDIIERDIIMCEQTNRNPESIRVCIPIQKVGAIAGTPCMDVKWANKGFDWDDNKFMIYPAEDLSLTDPNDFDKLADMRSKLDWKESEIYNLKSDIKKLEKKLKELSDEQKD